MPFRLPQQSTPTAPLPLGQLSQPQGGILGISMPQQGSRMEQLLFLWDEEMPASRRLRRNRTQSTVGESR